MTRLTIEIPDKSENVLCDLVEHLGGKIITKNVTETSSKAEKKDEILNDLEDSVKWVKQHQAGKVKAKSIEKLLGEL